MRDRNTEARLAMLLVLPVLVFLSPMAFADADADADADAAGEAMARKILNRPANPGRVGTMNFELINKSGRSRTRTALMVHSESGEEVRLAIYFTSPAAIQDTAFLSHERPGSADATWLYLPVTERVRRLPGSERGDYFMGTDLTYGDIKDNFKFLLEDWHFRIEGEVRHEGRAHPVLTGKARTPEIAREMGYGTFRALVDTTTLFPVVVDFTDPEGEALKRVTIIEQGQVGGAWTVLRFNVVNHQTGHRTEIRFENMRYVPKLNPRILEANSLAYGVPRIP